ncbi:MAG: PQQ-dependent sugar dehydrogenase [Ilumatobacteraceae bacterium]
MFVAIAITVADPPLASAATVSPTGFTDTEWVSGLKRPYQMEFAPDGRLFVSQQGGRLRVIKEGVLLPTPFLTATVDARGDRGLIGIAFDPDFDVNHFVYVYYTTPSPVPHNRVSRFTADGDVAVAGSETVLIEIDDLGASTLHNGGSIHFGVDGKLYVTTGDNVQGAVAQSMTSLLGKVLRLNPDGSIPPDNPYATTNTGSFRAIWAIGLRNPFTFGIQPGTGRIFVDDVGAMTWEEIDEGVAGGNYGWPTTEGPTTNPRFVSPLFAYNHGSTDTTGCAIAGGTFYNPPVEQFPSMYTGQYFYADACSGWIRVLDPTTRTAQPFLSGGVGLIDVKTGPDGSLYYLSRLDGVNNPGIVHKVTFSGRPAIVADPVDTTVLPGEPATFTVDATGDAELLYQWQREGIDIEGANSSSYTLADPMLADSGAHFRVLVTNESASATSATATLTVTSNAAPSGTILTPASASAYNAGSTISFTASANDPEDGTLPASAFEWEVAFHHNIHTHTGPTVDPGPSGDATSGSFVVPDTGETSTDVFYRIHLTVTDSGGRSTESFVDVLPNTVTLDVRATPTSASDGLQIILDDQPHLSPYAEDSVVGMKRTLEVVSPQVFDGTTYNFAAWSDGGAKSHLITTPDSSSVYTASFARAPDASPPVVSIIAPAAGAVVSATTALSANATDNVGVVQVKWYVDGIEVAHDSAGPTWSQPWSTTPVSDGSHKIFAKARDSAGNWGTSPTKLVTVNNAPPPSNSDTTITLGPTATNDTTPTFEFTANISGSTFACAVDTASFTSCASPYTLTVQAVGNHTLAVRATGPSGAADPTPATRSFNIDTTIPTVSLTAPTSAGTVSGSVTLSATAADSVGVVTVKWFVDSVEKASDSDGAPWTRTWNSTGVLNGPHKIISKARDAAGNWGTSKVVSVTVSNP